MTRHHGGVSKRASIDPTYDVVIVGAGMAGLAAAKHLIAARRKVMVIDANSAPGGRVRSELIDGVTVDHGFQLLNPSYPEAKRMLNFKELKLREFTPGVRIRTGAGSRNLIDPFRSPKALLHTLKSVPGSRLEQLKFAAYVTEVAKGYGTHLQYRADGTARDALSGFEDITHEVLEPFLAGVLFDDTMSTSRRLVDVFLRSFVRGTPAVPAAGMGEIGKQLSRGIPLSLNESAVRVTPTTVTTNWRVLKARAVLIATDPHTAARLLPGLPTPHMRSGTTWWHRAPVPVAALNGGLPILTVDPERRGPLVNTVVMNAAAPEYASSDQALIASTALGTGPFSSAEISKHLSYLYEANTARWEVVAVRTITQTVPAFPVGTPFRQPSRLANGIFIAGDHRDTPSLQGALVSGRRAAAAIRHSLA